MTPLTAAELAAIRASVERDDEKPLVHYAQKDRRVLLAHVDAQAKEIEKLRALVTQADPWVMTRMSRHHSKAERHKVPYYKARHQREADNCEGWLVAVAAMAPREGET